MEEYTTNLNFDGIRAEIKSREPKIYNIVNLNDALEIYDSKCDTCIRVKNFAQQHGLTKIVMSDNFHLIGVIPNDN